MKNPWRYPEEYWKREEYQFNMAKHGALKHALEVALQEMMTGLKAA